MRVDYRQFRDAGGPRSALRAVNCSAMSLAVSAGVDALIFNASRRFWQRREGLQSPDAAVGILRIGEISVTVGVDRGGGDVAVDPEAVGCGNAVEVGQDGALALRQRLEEQVPGGAGNRVQFHAEVGQEEVVDHILGLEQHLDRRIDGHHQRADRVLLPVVISAGIGPVVAGAGRARRLDTPQRIFVDVVVDGTDRGFARLVPGSARRWRYFGSVRFG